MDRERLEKLSTLELEDLRSEIDFLLAWRKASEGGGRYSGSNVGRGVGSTGAGYTGREVIEERTSEHGILRREVATGPDGPTGEPRWYLYYYAETKTGKRRMISENLGRELPPEYRG